MMYVLRIAICWPALAGVVLTWAAPTSIATELQITVTNEAPAGGFSLTPVWLGIQDGTFDTFSAGQAASAEVESVAELGDTGPITAAFAGQGPQTTLFAPGPFTPGATASTTLDVATPATNRYLSYLSMIVPSNDLFIGNGDPMGIELFDAGGNFVGPVTVLVFGSNVYDAGTELNDASDGPAFVVGQTGTDGTDQDGLIQLFLPDTENYLGSLLGVTTAAGYELGQIFGDQTLIATIEITEVPEPSALALAGIGIAIAFGALRSKHSRSRRSRDRFTH